VSPRGVYDRTKRRQKEPAKEPDHLAAFAAVQQALSMLHFTSAALRNEKPPAKQLPEFYESNRAIVAVETLAEHIKALR
jgi:hypothetical protein